MKVPAIALGLAISIPLANAYTGDLTHYTPGLGSCGETNSDSDAIVALSTLIMAPLDLANPNNNPLCNKKISIHNPSTGTDTIATITDTCAGCAWGSIDVTISLFNTIAPTGDGRVHGLEWTPVDWTMPSAVTVPDGQSVSSTAQSSAPSAVQPSPSPAASTPSAAPSAPAAAPSSAAPSSPAAAPSAAPSAPAAASSSPAVQPSSAPTGSPASCPSAGESVCSADGTQIGICTTEFMVQFGPVADGTKCENGYLVMATSRLRSRRA